MKFAKTERASNFRNNRKKDGPVSVLGRDVKEPFEMSIAFGARP